MILGQQILQLYLYLYIRFATTYGNFDVRSSYLWPLLLTWINFNPSMDK